MAPELFGGAEANVQTDLYAIGVTLYHLLTRKYPYGEIEPFQHPKFGEPVPPARTRPDLPPWLENVILKAVARDPAQRFETAEEMLLALERGEASPLLRRRAPLIERSPAGAWPLVAAVSIALNLMLLFLLLVS
jgi:protein phosphatase